MTIKALDNRARPVAEGRVGRRMILPNRRLVAEQEPEELDRLTLLMMTSLFDLEAAQWPHRNG